MRECVQETCETQHLNMTTLPIPGLVIRLAIPTVISMLVTALYNTADTFFVSRLGTSASGAVGIVFSIMAIFQAIGFTFGTGAASMISRKLGAQETKAASRYASTSFFLAFVSGLIFTVYGLFSIDDFMISLGSTETILPYAKSYAMYILLGAPIMCTSFVMNNVLRAEGKAAFAMVGLVTGALLNIVLDPIFIFSFGLGISGAAIATLISQCISFSILLSVFILRKSSMRISIKNISRKPKEYFDILTLGTPSLCRQGLASIATVALNVAASAYGDAAVAAMSIVGRTFMLVLSMMIGLGQGFMPVSGYNYGAKNYARVKEAFWFTVKTGLLIMAVTAVTGFVMAPEIVSTFRREDAEVIAIGTLAMRLQFSALILQPLFVSTNMLFQSTGHAARATFLACNRQGVYFLPLILILPSIFGITGIQITQPISDILSFLTCIPFLYFFMKKLNKLEKEKIS
ncbi:MAG: MATE family efflux transporter [Synergistaceae bacterium]|nr:MATE family efflux transporter [Synergistaceae bacterium]